MVHPHMLVPDAVAKELQHPAHLLCPGHDLLERGWIQRHALEVSEDPTLPRHLGAGERQAIGLARQMNSILLVDDWEARKAAEARGIRTTATLRTLACCKKRGLLPAVRPLLEEMVTKGFWLGRARKEDFLRQIGEL